MLDINYLEVSRSDHRCFVYALLDPRTDECRWVGCTESLRTRIEGHAYDKTCAAKAAWLNELRDLGLAVNVIVLEYIPPGPLRRRVTSYISAPVERRWVEHYFHLNHRLFNTRLVPKQKAVA